MNHTLFLDAVGQVNSSETYYFVCVYVIQNPAFHSPNSHPPIIHSRGIYWVPTNFPGGSDSKESPCNAGDLGSIPGWGRSPGKGNGYPLQYSCLENPMDKGAWWATACEVAKSQTWLSVLTLHTQYHITCKLWLFYFFSNLDSFYFFFFPDWHG